LRSKSLEGQSRIGHTPCLGRLARDNDFCIVGGGQLGGASIYTLLCSDGGHYAGVTRRSVDERVSEHAQGLMRGCTFTRRPVKLVFSEHYERIVDAIAAERRIKGWSRAKKRGLHARGFLRAGGACEERLRAGRVAGIPNRWRAMDRPSRLLLRKSASGRGGWSGGRHPCQRQSLPPKLSSIE
jgi:putative endonuclease